MRLDNHSWLSRLIAGVHTKNGPLDIEDIVWIDLQEKRVRMMTRLPSRVEGKKGGLMRYGDGYQSHIIHYDKIQIVFMINIGVPDGPRLLYMLATDPDFGRMVELGALVQITCVDRRPPKEGGYKEHIIHDDDELDAYDRYIDEYKKRKK